MKYAKNGQHMMSSMPIIRPALRIAYGSAKQPAPTTEIHIVKMDPLMDPAANLLATNSKARELTDPERKSCEGNPLPRELSETEDTKLCWFVSGLYALF